MWLILRLHLEGIGEEFCHYVLQNLRTYIITMETMLWLVQLQMLLMVIELSSYFKSNYIRPLSSFLLVQHNFMLLTPASFQKSCVAISPIWSHERLSSVRILHSGPHGWKLNVPQVFLFPFLQPSQCLLRAGVASLNRK